MYIAAFAPDAGESPGQMSQEIPPAAQSCVTPVYGLTEAAGHPHNVARGTYFTENGLLQPAPAPRFQGTPAPGPTPAPVIGTHTREVLTEIGLDKDAIDSLAPRA